MPAAVPRPARRSWDRRAGPRRAYKTAVTWIAVRTPETVRAVNQGLQPLAHFAHVFDDSDPDGFGDCLSRCCLLRVRLGCLVHRFAVLISRTLIGKV